MPPKTLNIFPPEEKASPATPPPITADHRRYDSKYNLGYDMNGGLLGSSNSVNDRRYSDSGKQADPPNGGPLLSQDDILMKLRFTGILQIIFI